MTLSSETDDEQGAETRTPDLFQPPHPTDYAGFWRRVFAEVLDTLLLTFVLFPVEIILGIVVVMATDANENSSLIPIARILIDLVSLFAWWLYSSLLESSPWQATLGKKALGIRVTDLNGSRISFGRASGRYFAKVLSGLICFVGLIMVAFTERKQGLHDLMAGTLVLKGSSPNKVHPLPPSPPDFGSGESM
jgi:uncharacterized RDD family membrane protein YckC